MKALEYSELHGSRPVWMGDEAAYSSYIPGGANLKASTVPASGMVYSGSLVGRTANGKKFHFIPPTATRSGGNFVTNNSSSLTADAAIGATKIFISDNDGFVAGDSISVNGTPYTILSVNNDNSIDLTSGLSAGVTAGQSVTLSANQPFTELFLTATEITDVNANAEFTQYRHARLVYINFLPGFEDFSADVLATIKQLYHYIVAAA